VSELRHVDVLMYHSIGRGGDPTHIGAELFAEHLAALEEAGYHIRRFADLASPESTIFAEKTAIVTFDDAYADFCANAAPELIRRNWPATVFTPTGWVGKTARWRGARGEQLLDWPQIRELAGAGIEFGSHAVSHRDLTRLPTAALREELVQSRARIEQELGAAVGTFAAPYGAANGEVRAEIARVYDAAAGVRLARALPGGDLFDVPRIEMHYFRDVKTWRRFLAREATGYFAARQAMRSIRAGISHLASRFDASSGRALRA